MAVISLLTVQASLLAYSATRHSPTYLEPAFLVSGISHWRFGRFEAYRVNPPLVRMVAALPTLAVGYKSDWNRLYDGPGARSEFPLGVEFVKANGSDIVGLMVYARWACIPFNLIGAYIAYRWAMGLYGPRSGLITLILFVFEPNLLAHGELITPDGACTSFGLLAGYTFWNWLKQPSWLRAGSAGVSLGLAELSKLSWLILFGLWPLLWLLWRLLEPRGLNGPDTQMNIMLTDKRSHLDAEAGHQSALSQQHVRLRNCRPSLVQLATILILAIYLINIGYAFDGIGQSLKDFQFVSTTFNGLNQPGVAGNRFQNSLLGSIPLPLPKQYVLGLDAQKKDFEDFQQRSFLRGEWKHGGWWYYYAYGLWVKVPCGTWALFAVVVVCRSCSRTRAAPFRDELVLLAPALTLFALVSSQTEFNIHLRYVFPALGLVLVFLGQAGIQLKGHTYSLPASLVYLSVFYSVTSCLCAYPYHLAYFNDFVGGARYGHKHLLGSSLDWGQDVDEAITWIKKIDPAPHIAFCMDSDSVASALLGNYEPVNESADGPATQLILYSADRYSNVDDQSDALQQSIRNGIVIKRFESGSVLVRDIRR